MRRPFVAGNWKMHKTLTEARELMAGLRAGFDADWNVTVAVCPPYQLLFPMGREVDKTTIKLGAQNVYCQPQGAFTGEVSPAMLVDCRCEYVIVGHSERRQHFGETEELLARKIRAAMKAGLKVIYCVGELLEQRDAGDTEKVVARQLDGALAPDLDASRLTIAYEPVWAIGTGKTATPAQAQQVHAFVRARLAEIFDQGTAEATNIQYGGSVKPNNAEELLSCPDVDGALVGGACLVPDDFLAIIRAAHEMGG